MDFEDPPEAAGWPGKGLNCPDSIAMEELETYFRADRIDEQCRAEFQEYTYPLSVAYFSIELIHAFKPLMIRLWHF